MVANLVVHFNTVRTCKMTNIATGYLAVLDKCNDFKKVLYVLLGCGQEREVDMCLVCVPGIRSRLGIP